MFQSYGQLLLGLCYLPTSERMTVAILKANNLMRLKESEVGVGKESFIHMQNNSKNTYAT